MNKTKSLAGLLTLLCTILFVSSFALFAGCGNKVKITFNLNYENPTTSIKAIKIAKETCVDDDEDVTWPTTVNRDGYTFVGWYDNADGTGTAYLSSTEIDDDITLYAKWQKNNGSDETIDPGSGQTTSTCSVKFNLNWEGHTQGGYSITQGKSFSEMGYTFPDYTGQRDGYTFNGWWQTSNFTGTQFTSTTKVPLTSTITLYAKWTANSGGTTQTYTIIFYGNGGVWASEVPHANDETQQTYYNKAQGLSITIPSAPTKSGSTFAGWWTAPSGGTQLTGTTYTVRSSDASFYAHWTTSSGESGGQTTNTITITWNAGSGSFTANNSSTYNQSISKNSAVTPPTFKATPSGKAFVGWYTSASGGDVINDVNFASGFATDISIYAHWNDINESYVRELAKYVFSYMKTDNAYEVRWGAGSYTQWAFKNTYILASQENTSGGTSSTTADGWIKIDLTKSVSGQTLIDRFKTSSNYSTYKESLTSADQKIFDNTLAVLKTFTLDTAKYVQSGTNSDNGYYRGTNQKMYIKGNGYTDVNSNNVDLLQGYDFAYPDLESQAGTTSYKIAFETK